MFKTCSVCGKIHSYNSVCCKRRTKRKQTEADELRAKNKWHEKSRQVREHFLCCLVCYDKKKIFVFKDLDVHHIVPLAEDPSGLLDDSNLCPLCRACHQKADAQNSEYTREYLRELVARYQDNPPVFEGFQKSARRNGMFNRRKGCKRNSGSDRS